MNRKEYLSTLWIVLSANFIFCDVFSLHYAPDLKNLISGEVSGTKISQEFLLSFSLIMEIPMLMILLSRILKPSLNRILNILFGIILFLIQSASFFWGTSTMHYQFFSLIEISICLSIVYLAISWKKEVSKPTNLA